MSNANTTSARTTSARSVSGARGRLGNPLVRTAVLAGILSSVSALAHADGAKTPDKTPDGSLTMYGITLYGTVDIGYQYQSHGTPVSDYFPAGTAEPIQKNSNHSVSAIVGNNLSQSKIGVQGREEVGDGWAGVFKLEAFFNPWSGHISDALKSLTQNNGVALASQVTGVDSSIAGQFFGGAAYGGISHKDYGTLTFGRQNGHLADGIAKYDPMGASQAFSLVGFSGTWAGAGDTEDRRLDASAKYDVTYQQLHFGAQFQGKSSSNPGTSAEFVLGMSFPGGSVDAYYVKKNDAISAGSLSAAQVTTLNCPYVATAANCPQNVKATVGGGGNALDKSLSGTISDNSVFSIMGKYAFLDNKATAFAGYEHINYKNPSNLVAGGQNIIGGYVLAYTNNAAFPSTKTLQLEWVGLKYQFDPKWNLTGAFYHFDQNSYAVGANAGCSSATVSGQCSGDYYVVSFVGTYRFTKRFDVYAGAMYSDVKGGLANGYLYTSTIDPTLGVRYTF